MDESRRRCSMYDLILLAWLQSKIKTPIKVAEEEREPRVSLTEKGAALKIANSNNSH